MADRRPRILLHPGFHKTGTSSIQHFLHGNRAALAPLADVLLQAELLEAGRAAEHFSRHGRALALADLEALVAALDCLSPGAEDRDLVISHEALAGHLPGSLGVADWSAVPVLAASIGAVLAERRPEADLLLAFTTRREEAWLDSAWRHLLKGTRLTLDRGAFARSHAAAADLEGAAGAAAEAAAAALAQQGASLAAFVLPLEEAALHPLGPGGALIELLDLPEALRRSLRPVGHGNRGPDSDLAAELLALNRSDLPLPELRRRKAELTSGLRGWRPA